MIAPRLAVAALALSSAAPAAAAVTYDFTARFETGPLTTLTGFFTQDGDTLTDFGLTIGDTVFGRQAVETVDFEFLGLRFDVIVGILDGSILVTPGVDDFAFQKTTSPASDGVSEEIFWDFQYSLDGLPEAISSSGVTVVERAAAVPEPASWAMMIAGFGLLGTTLRRGRRLATA